MSVLYRHKSRVEKRLHQIWEINWEGVRRIGNTWLFIRTVKQLFTIPGHQGMQGAWARYPRPDFFLPLSPACKWKRRLGRFSGSRKTGTTGWTRCKSSEGSCSRLDDTLPKNLTIILLKLTLYLLQSPQVLFNRLNISCSLHWYKSIRLKRFCCKEERRYCQTRRKSKYSLSKFERFFGSSKKSIRLRL